MCNPLMIAAAGTAIDQTKTIMSFVGQRQAAKANRVGANMAYGEQRFELDQRNAQIDQQQSENHVDAIIAAAKQAGSISASASDMGVDASTTASLMNDASFAAGRGVAISDLNSTDQRLQSANLGTKAEFDRVSQINRVRKPGYLELGIDYVANNLKGFSTYANAGGTF